MTTSEHIVEVSSATFDDQVIRRSHRQPVLVDFWAPWCGPCRVLGPLLERLADEMAGALVLAKVDSDRNPELAAQYRVQGIPNVQLFKDGQPVDQFVGALPEAEIRAFLRPHCPTAADRLIADGEQRLAAGDLEGAEAAFSDAVDDDPRAGDAQLGLARLALARGDSEAVARHAAAIPLGSDAYQIGEHLRQAATLVKAAHAEGDADALAARLEADDGDLEARFALGGHALGAGQNRQALEHYLAVAERDRGWRDQAARRAMLTVFGIVGVRDPLSDTFRDQLRRIYF